MLGEPSSLRGTFFVGYGGHCAFAGATNTASATLAIMALSPTSITSESPSREDKKNTVFECVSIAARTFLKNRGYRTVRRGNVTLMLRQAAEKTAIGGNSS